MKNIKEQKFSTFKRIFTLQVNDVLLALGYKTKCYAEEFYEIHFEDNLVKGRVIIDEKIIQFGYKSTFDKWSNSVDFTIDIPFTLEQLSNVIEEIKQNKYKQSDRVVVSRYVSYFDN